MDVKLFSLTTFDDEDNVFALGMSIVRDNGDQEAVTFRRDPVNGHSTFAVFESPQAACNRFSVSVPLKVEWLGEHRNGTTRNFADRASQVCTAGIDRRRTP